MVNDDENTVSYPPRNERSPMGNHKQPKRTSFIKDLMGMLFRLFLTFIVFTFIQANFVATALVSGESMEPTLSDGDYLIVNKYTEPERFDVLIFIPPDKPDVQYVKRIIGVPGDTIEYIDNQLYVNDEHIDEPYVDYVSDFDESILIENYSLESLFNQSTVPEGHYFVVGDNRDNSRDSRSFGYITHESVIGIVGKKIRLPELFN